MAFEDVIGQEKPKEILRRALKQGRTPHAYLFYGPSGAGKEALALQLAKALICRRNGPEPCDHCSDCKRIDHLGHPDVIFIFPAPLTAKIEEEQAVLQSVAQNPYRRLEPWATASISIERIREIRKVSALTSFEGKGHVIIIADAHRMTEEASNALLKILEEPPDKMTFILTTSQLNLLLPTIVSRCQSLQFNPLSWQEIEEALLKRMQLDPDQARLTARLSFGSFRRAMELLEEDLPGKRKKTLDVLRGCLKSELDILLMVEDLAREGKKLVKDVLGLLHLWFRDAMLLNEWGDISNPEEKLVNVDQLETLKKFLTSFDKIEFERIVFEIEDAMGLIDRNVYINLILLHLFNSLKKNMRRKKNGGYD